MKRLVNLIGGVVAGTLVMGACLYAVAWSWPRLAALRATPTVPAVAAVTATPKPTEALSPAGTATSNSLSSTPEGSSLLQELTPIVTAPASTSDAPGTGRLTITRQSLQSPYEALGFDFQNAQLSDNRDHWVASSPDGLALVDIVGAEAVEGASVTVFGPVRGDTPEGAQRAIYILTMLNAILPGWAERADWFADELASAARQPGDYQSEITHDGVRVSFTVDAVLGSLVLTFEPGG